MSSSKPIPVPCGVSKIVSRAELKDYDAWPKTFRDKAKDHRYYEIVEQTLANDFEHHYLILEDDSGCVRGIQPVFFVRQNLVEGMPGRIRTIVDRVRNIFPRFLTMRVLMVGCAAGAGELGTADSNDEQSIANALAAALPTFARQNKASLIVLKDFPARLRSTLEILRTRGYARVPSMPMTRLVAQSRQLRRLSWHASDTCRAKVFAENFERRSVRRRSTWKS